MNKTKRRGLTYLLALLAPIAIGVNAQVPEKVSPEMAAEKGCISCHEGIEDIREETSAMLAQIKGMGGAQGDPRVASSVMAVTRRA